MGVLATRSVAEVSLALRNGVPDRFEDPVSLSQNIGVPESQDLDSFGCKPSISDSIPTEVKLMIVLPAVDFDRQFEGGAVEIEDIAASRVLTSKGKTLHLSIS
jgi:hypothetical protein